MWVVKSQIHAGGRGKGTFTESPKSGGGVRVVKSVDDDLPVNHRVIESMRGTERLSDNP